MIGKTPQINFFIGKGGVGKSTTSALTSLFFSGAGLDTLLVSMDPAHNQRDIFESDFSEKPRHVAPRLAVKEIDTEYWISRYLKETRDNIRKTYLYESAFNLEDHFKVLQFSPGLEEFALLTAFENVLSRYADKKDVIVFDMAPTALSLRFFSLPSITLVWLDELQKLRNLICEKKEIVSRIRIGRMDFERDRVKDRLRALIENHTRLRDRFQSDSIRIHLVMNNDRLSVQEALRIRRRLVDFGARIERVVVNKTGPGESVNGIAAKFTGMRVARFPINPTPLLGLSVLENYVREHGEAFADLPSC